MPNLSGLAESFAVVASETEVLSRYRQPKRKWETYISCALLIEMIADGSLDWTDNKLLTANDTAKPAGDSQELLAEMIGNSSKPRTFRHWIKFLYSRRNVRQAVVEACVKSLLDDGDLRFETRRMFGIFPVSRYTADTEAKDRIIQRLRAEMLEPGNVDEQTAVLAMLLESLKLLKRYFSDYEREAWKGKLKQLQEEQSELWKRVKEIRRVIQEIESAAATGAIAASAV